MRITAKLEYAVRACRGLACVYEPGPNGGSPYVKADRIAGWAGTTVQFAREILNELVTAGLVDSKRGSNGGYRLAVPPETVEISRLVRLVDGPVLGFSGNSLESRSGSQADTVADVWAAVSRAASEVLDRISLADIAVAHAATHTDLFWSDLVQKG